MAAEQEVPQACPGSGSTSLIQEGDQVVLRMDKSLKIVQVRKNRKIFFEKLHFVIDGAINSPYGSVFEVKRDQLNLIKPSEDADELQTTSAEIGEKSSEYQPIKSDGQSQKLTRDDVDALKSQGVSGQEIVKQLVENSETFKDRTEFSQAKYKNKKNKNELRPDSLSQLLSLANIRANSKVIVVEQCQGLVVGAILDRMGGCGNIVQIHSGDFPNRLAMECYGFSSSFMEKVSAFPLNKVNSLKGSVQQKESTNPSQTVGDIGEGIMEKEVDETKQQQPSEEQGKDTSSSETIADRDKETTKIDVEEMKEQPPATSSKPSEEPREEDATNSETVADRDKETTKIDVEEMKEQPPATSSKPPEELREEDATNSETVADRDKETTKIDVEEMKEQPPATSSKPSEELREDDVTTSETVGNKGERTIEKVLDEAKQQPSVSSSKPSDHQSPVADIKEQEKIKRRYQRQLEERNARNALLSRNMDSLVVVCKLDPSTIVLGLLDYVAPSRPFVIFSTFKEPLVECYADLKKRGGAVNLQLTETWWREYQVLPGRTHPLVNMDGSGGYLLSGTTVERPAETDSSKMNTQDERTAVPQTPRSTGKKHGPSQTQEGEAGEPPAKKTREQTGTVSGERTGVPVTHSEVTVIESQKIQDKCGETPVKKWKQRGKRAGRRFRMKAGDSITSSSEGCATETRKEEAGKTQAKKAKEQTEMPQKRAGIPVTPSIKVKASTSQAMQSKTGEPPAKKRRQRGKRSGNKAFKNTEIDVHLPFPPPHSHHRPLSHSHSHPLPYPHSHPHSYSHSYSHPHPFSPPSLLSLSPRPPRTRLFQFNY